VTGGQEFSPEIAQGCHCLHLPPPHQKSSPRTELSQQKKRLSRMVQHLDNSGVSPELFSLVLSRLAAVAIGFWSTREAYNRSDHFNLCPGQNTERQGLPFVRTNTRVSAYLLCLTTSRASGGPRCVSPEKNINGIIGPGRQTKKNDIPVAREFTGPQFSLKKPKKNRDIFLRKEKFSGL
jgi:hypothetical protein